MILEGFADKLADIIVKGQAFIGDWRSEAGAKIHVGSSLAPHGRQDRIADLRITIVNPWFF